MKIQNSTLVVNADGNAVFVDKETAEAEEAEKLRLEEQKRPEEALEQEKLQVIADADLLAKMYDYDGAIAHIQAYEGYTQDTRFTEKIAEYEAIKATCIVSLSRLPFMGISLSD